MAKQITFEFEGKEYVLEFTRKSIETMDKKVYRNDGKTGFHSK